MNMEGFSIMKKLMKTPTVWFVLCAMTAFALRPVMVYASAPLQGVRLACHGGPSSHTAKPVLQRVQPQSPFRIVAKKSGQEDTLFPALSLRKFPVIPAGFVRCAPSLVLYTPRLFQVLRI